MKEYELVETLVEFYKGKGNTIGRYIRERNKIYLIKTSYISI